MIEKNIQESIKLKDFGLRDSNKFYLIFATEYNHNLAIYSIRFN